MTIKTGWFFIQLPGVRQHSPDYSTYSLFSYEELPPIQERLDDEFRWLRAQPVKRGALNNKRRYYDKTKFDTGRISKITTPISIELPESFLVFLGSENLHRRIRSNTDCYLDLADCAVRTRGSTNGFLIHFLSDSQWCLHWYLHLDDSGNHCVVVSPKAYGFIIDAKLYPDAAGSVSSKGEINLKREEIILCAHSFPEFIYRFWLENELWFALTGKQPLTSVQQAYVDHYRKDRKDRGRKDK